MPTFPAHPEADDSRPARVFVGRARELAELVSGLEDAVAGRGRLFFVVGEPGIGKTRLAEELALAAAGRARVVWGRCLEGGDGPAYDPWVQVLRALRRDTDDAALARLLDSSPLSRIQSEGSPLARKLPASNAAPTSEEAADARFAFFDAVMTALRAAAERQPLVLLLDDVHDADQPSLQLLRFLARTLVDARILLVATYREMEVRNDAARAAIVSAAARYGRRLPLGGLSEEEVGRLIRGSFALAPTPAVCAEVHRTTDGNPFFVDEIVRLLVAEHHNQLPEEIPATGLPIPHGVREAIRQRLRPLPADTRAVLEAAAVVGREFDLACLTNLFPPLREQLPALLRGAEGGGLVHRRADKLGGYLFAHALIRETLYDDLPPARRIELHRQVGEILEARYEPDLDPHLDELSHHFEQAATADPDGRALRYLTRAGARAMEMLAYEDAAARYRRALDALRLQDPDNRVRELELLLAGGEALARAGNTASAEESFARAAALARQLGRSESFARAALGFGGTSFGVPRGSAADPTLLALLEEAIELLHRGTEATAGGAASLDPRLTTTTPGAPVIETAPRGLLPRLLARLAVELYFSDSAARRAEMSEEAMRLARESGDPATLAYVANARHFALWDSPDAAQRLAVANEAIAAAERAGDRDLASRGHFWRLMDLLELGEASAWEREIEVFAGIAEDLRQPRFRSLAASLRATRALWRGRFAEVEAHVQQALALADGLDDGQAPLSASLQSFALHRLQGRTNELEPLVRGWVAHSPSQPAARAALALVLADLGRLEECGAEFAQLAAHEFADLARSNRLVSMIPWLAEICAALGDGRRADRLYRSLLPFAGNVISAGYRICFGPACRYLGLLATTFGDGAAAQRHFEDALAQGCRMKGAPYVAMTQLDLARFLYARGSEADLERARELAADAGRSASDMGMAGVAGKARDLAAQLGSDGPRSDEPQESRVAASGGGGARTDAPSARVVPFSKRRGDRAHLAALPRRARGADAPTGAAVPPSERPERYEFRLEGEYWSIGRSSALFRLKDSLGLRYLARLLAEPGRELHVTDLVDAGRGPAEVRVSGEDLKALGLRGRGSPDPASERLDARARRAYRERLGDLRHELDEAERFNDVERARRLREEIVALTHELGSALRQGRGSASRDTERARVSVTRVIKAAVRRITASDRDVGLYLATTVKTGTYCSYRPDPRLAVEWLLSGG